MNPILINMLPVAGCSLFSAAVLFPVLIKLSPKLGLVDIPNDRKLHSQPVPAIGGLVIGLTLFLSAAFSNFLQQFMYGHKALVTAMAILMVTGLIDDRRGLPPLLRLFIQLFCAIEVAAAGVRIESLHGIMGLYQLPDVVSWVLTVVIITGVTNAFNLIDGIDGLAGLLSLVNIFLLSVMSIMLRQLVWLQLFLPLLVALLVFLKYNWRPAKVFMGDSGSLLFGFLCASLGIDFIREAQVGNHAFVPAFVVLITGACMIPVLDALRVFYKRIKKGMSPFKADKTHLHHLLLKHHLAHSAATRKLLNVHLLLLLLSVISVQWVPIFVVIAIQILFVIAYISAVNIISCFHRWYRFIKKKENEFV